MEDYYNTESQVSNIIVFVDNSPYGVAALAHAEVLASIFKTTVEKRYSYDPLLKPRLLKEAEERNTILFVIGVAAKGKTTLFNKNKAIQFIKDSRIPTMVVNTQLPQPHDYKKVVLPLDVERQAKEKAMWGSYFSRYRVKHKLGIEEDLSVQIHSCQYKDEFLRDKTQGNVAFAERIYNSLEVPYQKHTVPKDSVIDDYALEWAARNNCSPLAIMMTSYRSIADLLLGTNESKIIGKEMNVPILCLNPRDDLYVLCT